VRKAVSGDVPDLRLLRGAAGSDEEEWLSACEADVDAGAGGECGILIAISSLSDN
jgi:hypothetical protein